MVEPEEALRKIEGMFDDYWGALSTCLEGSSVTLAAEASRMMDADKEVFEVYINILKKALNIEE